MVKRKRTTHSADEAIIRENINLLPGGMKENKNRYLFATRLNKLLEEKEITQEKFADKLQISTGSVSNYRKGKEEPQLTLLTKMAKLFDISTDYLSGASDYESSNIEVIAISNQTGLSHKTIEILKEYNLKYHDYMNTINFLLEQETLPLVKEEIAFMKDTSSNKFHTLEKQLEKRNFIPIIDVIHEYFITNVNKNKEIYINYGPTITDKDGKIISIDDTISTNKSIITRRNVSSDMIIDNVYLDDIKDRLKQAKPKYVSQFSSEVDE